MGWLKEVFSGGVAGTGEAVNATLNGAGDAAIKIRSAITGDISPDKKAEIELGLQEIESKIMLAQAKIGEAEAKSSSMFIAGGRPFIIWICGISLGYAFLFRPIFYDLFLQYFNFTLQAIEQDTLMNLVVAILGLGAFRTYEKKAGVQNNH